MTIQAILTALCLLCAPVTSVSASSPSEQCYRSEQLVRQVHRTEHIYHHQTPQGVCYHIGAKNHSTAFVDTKPLPKKVGIGTVKSSKDKWSSAKPVPERDRAYIEHMDSQMKYWRFEWNFRP